MEVSSKTLAGPVHRGGDVLEQHQSGGVHLLQPLGSPLQIPLGVLQLPDKARGEPGLLQDPRVLTRKTFDTSRVIRRDQTKALVAGAPGHGDGIPHAERVEHVAKVAGVIRPRGPEHQVVKHHTAGDVVVVRTA